MIRFPTYGPRSLTRTIIHLPFFRFVTFTKVPKGSFRCAAVSSNMSKSSPLAVVLPWNCLPYQDALPTWYAFNAAFGATFTNLEAGFFSFGVLWFLRGGGPPLATPTQVAALKDPHPVLATSKP